MGDSGCEIAASGRNDLATNIKDVALKAGVSIATVSHVLNGTRTTRPQTRRRVLAAIEELGYAQNQAARNLALGRSTLLGLIISDIRNPFFPEITAAFQDQALLHNMDAVVVNTNYDAHRTLSSVNRLIGLQVPALAILTSEIDPGMIDMLAERGSPPCISISGGWTAVSATSCWITSTASRKQSNICETWDTNASHTLEDRPTCTPRDAARRRS